jgi:hypothetical protein
MQGMKAKKRRLNRVIFNTALLALVLGMSAMDSDSYIPHIITAISTVIIFLYAYANNWIS